MNSLHKYAAKKKLITKLADIMFRPKKDKGAVTTAGGIFIGVPGDKKDPGYAKKTQKAAKRIQELLREKGSLQRARQAYSKENPSHFVTVAIKRENKPSSGLLGYKKLLGGKKYKSSLKSFADRSKKPRIFIRAGQSAGYQQKAFYREVSRGLRDDELNQPHVPKKDRIRYM